MAETKVGRQFPTQSVILPFNQSKGDEAVSLYEECGRKAQDWQKLLITDVMAVNDEGLWTHQKYGYEVPRQNGKGEVLTMRELWGLQNGERICHTAHKTSTSHSAFVRLVGILTNAGYVETGRKKKGRIDPEKSFKATKQYGLEQIFLKNGGYIVFRTRTEAGGIGESFDLLVIDEAQEYTSTQQSALIYTIAASTNPQTIFCGTPPTRSSKGDVFVNLRKRILSGKGFDTGWSEWSVYQIPENIMDPANWYETNPSLGTILRERTIRNEDVDNVLDFVIQRLGYWHSYELKSEISEKDWKALCVPAAPDDLTGKMHVGIKFGSDGINTAVSLAIKTGSGKTFVECIDCVPQQDGFAWIVEFLSRCKHIDKVVIDGKAKSDLLVETLRNQGVKVQTLIPSTGEAITAYSGFKQAIDTNTLIHCDQPSVTQSISNCERRMIGSNGGFGFRSLHPEIEVAIVESLALAHWHCSITKERRKQRIGY